MGLLQFPGLDSSKSWLPVATELPVPHGVTPTLLPIVRQIQDQYITELQRVNALCQDHYNQWVQLLRRHAQQDRPVTIWECRLHHDAVQHKVMMMMMIVYWYLFSNHYTRECIHTGERERNVGDGRGLPLFPVTSRHLPSPPLRPPSPRDTSPVTLTSPRHRDFPYVVGMKGDRRSVPTPEVTGGGGEVTGGNGK